MLEWKSVRFQTAAGMDRQVRHACCISLKIRVWDIVVFAC